MTYLITGLLLFAGIHLLPTGVALRQRLILRLGENAYKGLFSLIALAGIVLMVMGYSNTGKIAVYQPLSELRPLTFVLMAIAMVLFAAANMPTNIKRFTRHPMLWGLVLWSIAHLLANGDKAALLLFGGLGVYGLLGMLSGNRRGALKQQHKVPLVKETMTVAAGLVVYVVFIAMHQRLFGVAVI